jgi:hypothetical protein
MARTLDEQFDIATIVRGLASDLQQVRNGTMSIQQASAQADLAKQLFNGLRLVIQARKFLDAEMKAVGITNKRGPRNG